MRGFAHSSRSFAGVSPASLPDALRCGERVYLSAAHARGADGGVAGIGDAAAQTHAALDRLEAALDGVGGSLRDLTKLTTCIVDRGFRAEVYRAIAQRLPGVRPVSTGLVVAGLSAPEMIVQIDAEAAIPRLAPHRVRPYAFDDWHGQGFAWEGCMAISTQDEIFLRGQTGGRLDHSGSVGGGRAVNDAAEQADLALTNMRTLLEEAGSSLREVCKITVYVSDRAYRSGVYPVIGRHFGDVHPVSTGVVTTAFARPEIVVEIDAVVVKSAAGPHRRLRTYHTSAARYGAQSQPLDARFCMAVVAGDRILLRGQTGMGLDEKLYGAGDAVAQAEQAMNNVETLLDEAGSGIGEVVKATVYVTDRDYLEGVIASVLARFGASLPTFTSVIVKGLASPDLLMEVDIAADRRKGAS